MHSVYALYEQMYNNMLCAYLLELVRQLVDLQNEILEWKFCCSLQKQIQFLFRSVGSTMKHLKGLWHASVETNYHSNKAILCVAGAKMEHLDKLLNERDARCDTTRAEERGAGTATMGEGVVFEEKLEEGSHNFDRDIFCLLNGPLAELMSSLRDRERERERESESERERVRVRVRVRERE